jgi:hypothetical protein
MLAIEVRNTASSLVLVARSSERSLGKVYSANKYILLLESSFSRVSVSDNIWLRSQSSWRKVIIAMMVEISSPAERKLACSW